MIGAMYENGGNTTHRFLDGHPQMFVYPFESQLGTSLVNDKLSSLFPLKYRWPAFPLEGTAYQDYKLIVDEETKVRARTPYVSKFRHIPFRFSDDERCNLYQKYIAKKGRTRANNVEAFFRGTFDAWKNHKKTGKEKIFVGYSPALVVDAQKIFHDFPQAHFLHIVRNPWSAFADTKKRPVPLALKDYLLGWNLNQYFAIYFSKKYPDRFHLLRFEDILANPQKVLGRLCLKLGLLASPTLSYPSWNGEALQEVYPWGTIRNATVKANRATARELSRDEIQEITLLAQPYLSTLNYSRFLK